MFTSVSIHKTDFILIMPLHDIIMIVVHQNFANVKHGES